MAVAPTPMSSRARPWLRASKFAGGGVFVVVLLLVGLRLALPDMLRWYANREINRMQGYGGHVDDVGVSLWRGAYQLHGVEIRQLSSPSHLPLFTVPNAEIRVMWSALLEGRIVAEAEMQGPRVNFVAGRPGKAAQAGQGIHGIRLLKHLAGLRVDRVQVEDGRVHYYDPYSSPQVDIYLTHIQADANNFNRVSNPGAGRVATLRGDAVAMDQAKLDVDLAMDTTAKQPDFSLKLRAVGVDVTRLRDFTQAYTRVNPKKGTLDLVVQADAKDGGVQGYVKPIFHDLELFRLDKVGDDLDHPLSLVVDAVGSVINLLFQNQPKQQIATEVPFSGRLDAPSTDTSTALVNVFRNAFVKAFSPRFDSAKPESK